MNSSIAIDGPAGSGKSTITGLVAERLDLNHVDSGAFYRTITYFFIREGIDFNNIKEVKDSLENIQINAIHNNGIFDIRINGEDVKSFIRTREVTRAVSPVSAIPEVREKVNKVFRELSEKYNIIMEGRDIGTVVLPNADYKIYLNASVEERAKRRLKELEEAGEKHSLDDIYKDIVKRDEYDSGREIAPLKKAEDAVEIDTTSLSIEEVVEEIIGICRKNK